MNELPLPLSAKAVGSFAYKTVKDRHPVILTKVIDHLFRERYEIANNYGGEVVNEETKAVIGRLSKLRNELQTDKAIVPLQSNGKDIPVWNECIEQYKRDFGCEPSWFESSWLLVECYLYRRIREAFELTTYLSGFDPFREQKESSFIKSMDTVEVLSSYVLNINVPSSNGTDHDAFIKEHFIKFIELSLWGNKCDLSLSSGEHVKASDDPLYQIDSLRKNILSNESDKIYKIVQSHFKNNCKKLNVHIVLDNAGFELFSDLCLVDFLFQAGLAQTVYFHVKEIPWFVSDTLEYDFSWLLNYLSSHKNENLKILGNRWKSYCTSEVWVIKKEQFWTLSYDYSEMQKIDPQLYQSLSKANLIIFKGDLNYRKLTSDLEWKNSTPFKVALRGFCPAPLCTLRTIKAEVAVGLKDEVVNEVSSIFPNWMYSGDFGLIQCNE